MSKRQCLKFLQEKNIQKRDFFKSKIHSKYGQLLQFSKMSNMDYVLAVPSGLWYILIMKPLWSSMVEPKKYIFVINEQRMQKRP